MKRIFNGSGGRKAALILSLCLIFALAVGTTLALLKANTAPVTNTFKAATSEIKIEEKTDGGIKSEIYVKNEGTATSYVRVKLVCNWVDKDGNVTVGASLRLRYRHRRSQIVIGSRKTAFTTTRSRSHQLDRLPTCLMATPSRSGMRPRAATSR